MHISMAPLPLRSSILHNFIRGGRTFFNGKQAFIVLTRIGSIKRERKGKEKINILVFGIKLFRNRKMIRIEIEVPLHHIFERMGRRMRRGGEFLYTAIYGWK